MRNKMLKLEKESMKLKSAPTTEKYLTRFNNDKLKESLKSSKILHKTLLKIKDVKLAAKNLTIKSLESKINDLENSLTKLRAKFNEFQHQAD